MVLICLAQERTIRVCRGGQLAVRHIRYFVMSPEEGGLTMPIRFGCPHCNAIAHIADEYAGRVASCACCGNLMTVPHETNQGGAPTAPHDDVMYIEGGSSSRWGRKLLFWMGAVVCVLLLIALLLPAVQTDRRGPSRRMGCSNNLKQLALAMHNYHDVHGCFPPAYTTDEDGRPMHSWRIFLLPFIECTHLYDQYDFDQPWDSPDNMEVARQMPPCLYCPSGDREDGCTNYVVVIGAPDKFPQTMFTPDRSISFGDMTDGTTNTIMLVEVERGVPWTMPGADLHFDQMTFRINAGPASISSPHSQRAYVALADGRIYPLDNWLQSETLRNLLQPADGNPVDDF